MSLLDFGEDPPPSAPESDAAPAQAQGSDPFGDDPFGGDDLFGTGSGGGTTEDAFGEGAKSDDPFAGSGGDAFDPFSSPNAEQNKSPTTNSSAFDDFDPFSGPLLSPSAAPASSNDNSPQKEAFTFSSNDDPFGSADVSKPAAATDPTSSSDDPFGSDLLSGGVVGGTGSQDVAAAEDESGESKMAANGQQQQALEAQFDDLLGDMGGVNGEITRTTTTESTSEVSSSQGPATLAPVAVEESMSASLLINSQIDEDTATATNTDTTSSTSPTSPNLEPPSSTATNQRDSATNKPDGAASPAASQGEREGSPGLSDTASVEDQHDAPVERGFQREISAASTVSATSSHGSRFEDTIADFQPPKRYVKEEKKTPSAAAATTFIMKQEKRESGTVVDMGGVGENMCKVCQKRVYEMEKVIADNKVYHKSCFKCEQCRRVLSLGNFAGMDGKLYCKPHFISLFKTKGNYDEGFGKERHTKQWQQQQQPTETSSSSNVSYSYSAESGLQGQQEEQREIVRSDEAEEAPENLPSIRNLKSRFENTDSNTSFSSRENGSREDITDMAPQVYAVRSRYQVSESSSSAAAPQSPRQPSKWDKPASAPPPPVNHRAEDDEGEDDDLPPVAVTSTLVSRFRELESGAGTEEAAYRKPVRKMTPPRDELEAEVRQFVQQEVERDPGVIRADEPAEREEELPPPQYTRSLVSKFREIESSAPIQAKTPTRKTSTSTATITTQSSKQNRSPDSGISEPAPRSNGYHEESDARGEPVRETDQNVEEELPERGFTKSLLAQWQTKLQETGSKGGNRSSSRGTNSAPTTNGGVNRSWSYKQKQQREEYEEELEQGQDYVTPLASQASYASQDQVDEGGVSENQPERLEGVVRESDTNEEDYLPPPAYTRNILAKFQSMEAQQEPSVQPKQKQYKWQVKEPQTLRGPYNAKPRPSNGSLDGAGSDYEVVHADSPTNPGGDQDYEMPQPAYTKSVLAKFRTLEDSNLPPPSPERGGGGVKKSSSSSTSQQYEREQPDGDEYEDVPHREFVDGGEEEEELPEEGTTKNLLAKFKAMQA